MNVSNIICKLFCFRKSLRIRAIRRDRRTVADVRELMLVKSYKRTPMSVPTTISKSNKFQISVKYLTPKASILIMASNVKIIVKAYCILLVT